MNHTTLPADAPKPPPYADLPDGVRTVAFEMSGAMRGIERVTSLSVATTTGLENLRALATRMRVAAESLEALVAAK